MEGTGVEGPIPVFPREGLYLNPGNPENTPLPQNYSPPAKIAPKHRSSGYAKGFQNFTNEDYN